ncbi:ATP-binding cassette domain-containing protein [Alkalicoccus halolimnae]|uniref:ATP-binding cassette domain-containing protein n=1 Tax=Alkalicoccus halolimnae TaxID=1667239 RepID=A0A5C7FHL3_9BACI|nr:ATP-binding cassette domain-containing protein [Alkalicoccus halolimnae]TXF83298.1 ATP-binding cassette domain-containing protein [Alkalicoccus halolimnae]
MTKGTIEVHGLEKTFKDQFQAVKGISFSVKKGECFAFLGPNGAGKSTTVKMLTTLIAPTGGQALVSGYDVLKDPGRVRWEIGVVLQETGLDTDMTGRELLELQGRIFNLSKKEASRRAEELLKKVGLHEEADKRCGKYSGGMRRRLDLAVTLVHNPPILFLDEPTTGLDPLNRKAIWNEIHRLNKEEGTTIFLTTQYLEEADALADYVSIINDGEIAAEGTAARLKQEIGADVIHWTFTGEEDAQRAAETFLQREDVPVVQQAETVKVTTADAGSKLQDYISALTEAGISMVSVTVKSPTLDDVFISVTNEKDGGTK